MNEQPRVVKLSEQCRLHEAGQRRHGESRTNRRVSSAERPHLQLHDSEVIGFREATVIESVTGAAAAQI